MAGGYAKLPDLSNFSQEYIEYTNAFTLLSQAGALFGAAALIVLLRFYVRITILRSFGTDDWVMLAAFAFAIALFTTYIMETKVGLGRHLAVIQSDPEGYAQFLRLRQVHGIIIGIGVGLVKISIAFFLLRFVTLKRYRWFLHGLNVFMLLFTTACVFTLAINATTDFLLALLPIPLVWSLQLNLQAKISLIFVLTLGVFAGVAGIVKSEKQKLALYQPDQYVHDTFTIWWFVEYNVGMIAASLPALKPLFRRVLETARGTTLTRSSGRRYPSDLGYHKQDERSDKGIMMEYIVKSSNSVNVSSAQPGKSDEKIWRIGHAKQDEESTENLRKEENATNAIYVTRDVHVS